MPKQFSEVLGVSSTSFRQQGVFDGFYRFDSQFHIDPALLRVTRVPEIRGSHRRLATYFTDILRLLDHAQLQTGPLWNEAIRRLTIPEIPVAALGYSANSTAGRAIGRDTAYGLATTASEIIRAGVKDPVIFELVGLVQDGIGADLISDMTLAIILPDIIAFNSRIINNLTLHSTKVRLLHGNATLPSTQVRNDPILLLPEDILSPLPVAYSWDDIEIAAAYNAAVRKEVNAIIGRTWRQATNQKRVTKGELKRMLLKHPELLRELVQRYKGKPLIPYNFEDDPLGELVWQQAAESYAQQFPLTLSITNASDPNAIVATVMKICEHFRDLVESNGLFALLYDKQQQLKPERAAQLLFFGIADAYCRASNLDLSPESNSGRGPVDFKISSGYTGRLNVEVKYSSNTKLISGFSKQLPTYDAAEKSFYSIYLVLQTTKSDKSIKKLEKLRNDAVNAGKRSPRIVRVDARLQPPASHL